LKTAKNLADYKPGVEHKAISIKADKTRRRDRMPLNPLLSLPSASAPVLNPHTNKQKTCQQRPVTPESILPETG